MDLVWRKSLVAGGAITRNGADWAVTRDGTDALAQIWISIFTAKPERYRKKRGGIFSDRKLVQKSDPQKTPRPWKRPQQKKNSPDFGYTYMFE